MPTLFESQPQVTPDLGCRSPTMSAEKNTPSLGFMDAKFDTEMA